MQRYYFYWNAESKDKLIIEDKRLGILAKSKEDAEKKINQKSLTEIRFYVCDYLNENAIFTIDEGDCWISIDMDICLRRERPRPYLTKAISKKYLISCLTKLGLIYDKRFPDVLFTKLAYSNLSLLSINKKSCQFTCTPGSLEPLWRRLRFNLSKEEFIKMFPEFENQYEEICSEKDKRRKLLFCKRVQKAREVLKQFEDLSNEEKLEIEILISEGVKE